MPELIIPNSAWQQCRARDMQRGWVRNQAFGHQVILGVSAEYDDIYVDVLVRELKTGEEHVIQLHSGGYQKVCTTPWRIKGLI